MRVLVVDDEPAVREVARAHPAARGLRGRAGAATGARRCAARRQAPADAVLLDVLMPGLDGLEVCRRMRDVGDRTPVLMLTAREDVGDRVAGLEAGADDYLSKPFALEELLARLRALLRRSGWERRPPDAALRRPRARPGRPRGPPRRAPDRADADRVPAARAVPAPPAPGADARADLRRASGAMTSARRPTRSRSTSATCGARPRPAASRGCCTPCAASATCCGRREP